MALNTTFNTICIALSITAVFLSTPVGLIVGSVAGIIGLIGNCISESLFTSSSTFD